MTITIVIFRTTFGTIVSVAGIELSYCTKISIPVFIGISVALGIEEEAEGYFAKENCSYNRRDDNRIPLHLHGESVKQKSKPR